ncbi:UDP-N-acetylmuramoyl-L-alanine--D-glutamate ligase, partial [Peptostreptococcus porci]|uniref:UDP-N-acetylmuramoyl-L-alanine--D-glutamate ligase n=1 Tax=Peptostreptococcus porci TaxID=2652282 RepID=UPI002A90E3AF
KYLLECGAKVTVCDSKPEEILADTVADLKKLSNIELIIGRNPNYDEIRDVDFIVVSPGVPLELDFLVKSKENGKKIISEIELAYNVGLEKNISFVGITGTNGKTTTTSIMGEVCKAAGMETYVVGNIGNPAIEAVKNAGKGAYLVTELSSFQLESIEKFKPVVSTVLNLTEDHLNRHHTMENYARAKARIFENQTKNEICVLNYDDSITKKMATDNNSKIMFFSRKNRVENGVFLNEKNEIIFSDDGCEEYFMNAEDLSLPGGHNVENCMAVICMSLAIGIEKDVIIDVLKNFKAVEHRLEYVDTINGIDFVNDSKGTNPDSTIKAVQSYKSPIILIAGGYDKNSDFNELFEIAKINVRSVLVLGQTAELIETTARNHGIKEVIRVSTIKEAVEKSIEIANEKDVVLLSPACASWGMYNNYEERGNDFKECVRKLRG